MIRRASNKSTIQSSLWQSRAEILKDHLDSLSADELLRVRPDYYALRFGFIQSLRRKFDPDQPRLPTGDPNGGQWTSEGATAGPLESFAAARGRGRSAAFCATQYAVDGLLCNSVKPASRAAACWRQAAERLGNCLAGRPTPPLTF